MGVWQTLVTMGLLYFVTMLAGAFGYRLLASDWTPAGWVPPPKHGLITTRRMHADKA